MAHSVAAKTHQTSGKDREESDCRIPERPEPTPEQAALGVTPAAIGNGTFSDIMKVVRSFPRLGDEEFRAFESAIAENRTMRRRLAQERDA